MEAPDEAQLCFPQLLNTSCTKTQQFNAENVFLYVVLSLVSFLTVTLNLLVIISISHFRQLHTTTNFFLLSLAVSDFFVGLLLMPIRILRMESCWVWGSFMCGLYNYTSFIITSASVGNMVLISVDRYVAICDPLSYPNKLTHKRVQICVCLCWACSVLYNGMILKEHLKQPDKYNSCHGQCRAVIDFKTGTFDFIFTFFGPITVIMALYMRVFVVAVSQARAMRSHVAAVSQKGSAPVSAKRSERKAATALGVVVIVFLMCICPYFSPSLAGKDTSNISKLSVIGIWLLYANSCVNPIIYAFFYPWFRKSVKLTVTLEILRLDSCDANVL
ncbi:trace amine-associated receptor 13c-like [Nematolebias whitei]|uniref:trace amine-associated receptor 13c-like n=1 Tax=Nematolebias whitei TaxID=451745 RepID=UPI0018976C95|nr:trace amine-associated receptor 13c-like [Nematolebias whitei]